MNKRPSWHETFMKNAYLMAERTTCIRRGVGAVAVKGRRVLCTGYNGAPPGARHCAEAGCIREQLKVPSGERHELCRGVHAEQNLLVQAARFGVSLEGATIYVTTYPCAICAKLLASVKVSLVIYDGEYNDKLSENIFKESDISIIAYSELKRYEK